MQKIIFFTCYNFIKQVLSYILCYFSFCFCNYKKQYFILALFLQCFKCYKKYIFTVLLSIIQTSCYIVYYFSAFPQFRIHISSSNIWKIIVNNCKIDFFHVFFIHVQNRNFSQYAHIVQNNTDIYNFPRFFLVYNVTIYASINTYEIMRTFKYDTSMYWIVFVKLT